MKILRALVMSLTLLSAGTQRLLADELLIFTANWCGACQKLKKDVKANPDIFTEYTWGYVDTDQDPELARAYKVKSLPTLILVGSDNKEIRRQVGYDNTNKLTRWLKDEALNTSLRSTPIFTQKR